jgi:hypothetical protein
MRAMMFLLAALAASLSGAGPSAAALYSVNYDEGPIRVTGSMTADDVTGPLTIADIDSWNITATAPGIAIDFTPEDSVLFVRGNDLVSTGTEITFAYGSDDGGLFGFFEPVDGGSFPNGFPILCNATAGQNVLGCTQSGVTLGDPQTRRSHP